MNQEKGNCKLIHIRDSQQYGFIVSVSFSQLNKILSLQNKDENKLEMKEHKKENKAKVIKNHLEQQAKAITEIWLLEYYDIQTENKVD